MSPTALTSAIELITNPVRELLSTRLPLDHGIEFEDFLWIISTALIAEALRSARGNKSRAAKMLGMERNSLNSQIGELHLEPVIEGVKIAVDQQLNLFSRRKPSTPAHRECTELSRISQTRGA